MKEFLKMFSFIFISVFIFLFYSTTTMEGVKNKKNKKKHSNNSPPKQTSYATSVISVIRKIPFYSSLPKFIRDMIEKIISFIIFI